MTQLPIDWSRDVALPVQGRTTAARHAGSTGAQRAARDRGALALAYLALLRAAGEVGVSDYEAAHALGRLVSSLCSTRNGLGDLVTPSGSFEKTSFGTKRTRYQINRERDLQGGA